MDLRGLAPGRGVGWTRVMQDGDEALVARYRRGDVAAFEELLERHRRGVFRFLARFVGDAARAEDLAQDCWMRFIDAAPRWNPDGRFKVWIYAVARNLATDESRRAAHRAHAPLDMPVRGRPVAELVPSGARAPEDAAGDAEIRPRLLRAIGALPGEQREVFLLREYEGVSFAEIAGITGAPLPTVKSRMRYALEALRRALQEVE
jgi:RNA polymerase sigma-70 factor (ECF subfamily)